MDLTDAPVVGIGEAAYRTSGVDFRPDGAHMVINNKPPYPFTGNGFGPRFAMDWKTIKLPRRAVRGFYF